MTSDAPKLAEETIAPDEAAVTAEFIAFLKAVSAKHHPSGVMPRFNQGRAAGCVDAEFTVPDALPPELRVGLFAQPKTYRARIRFANATSQSDTERDVRGMSIKVSDVSGANLTPGESNQDFLLNSHPVMMVGGTKDVSRSAEGRGRGRGQRGALFRLTPTRGSRGAGVAPARDKSPRDSILEHHALPVRRRPGRQVHRASRAARGNAIAAPVDRQLSPRASHGPSGAGGCTIRFLRAVSERQPEDAHRGRERRMGASMTRRIGWSRTSASPHKRSTRAARRAPRPASRCRSIPGTRWPSTVRSATSIARGVISIVRWPQFRQARRP